MTKSFSSAAIFKASLESRIRSIAVQRNVPMNTLRLKIVIERLLARLFAEPRPLWILKGGYAMELRYRPRARTTRDIDLTCETDAGKTLQARLRQIRDLLQKAAEKDAGDFIVYRIENAQSELAGAPLGGARFPCEAFLAGKTYGRFHIDLGFGDDPGTDPEILSGDDLLSFAGIPPARVLAIPPAQQFAEKLHAYTRPWQDRVNMRCKDLVDMLLLIESGSMDAKKTLAAVQSTFKNRKTHPFPVELPDPPEIWEKEFLFLSAEAQLKVNSIKQAIDILRGFCRQVVKL